LVPGRHTDLTDQAAGRGRQSHGRYPRRGSATWWQKEPTGNRNGLHLGFATLRAAVFIDNVIVEDDEHLVDAPSLISVVMEDSRNVRVGFDRPMLNGALDPF